MGHFDYDNAGDVAGTVRIAFRLSQTFRPVDGTADTGKFLTVDQRDQNFRAFATTGARLTRFTLVLAGAVVTAVGASLLNPELGVAVGGDL